MTCLCWYIFIHGLLMKSEFLKFNNFDNDNLSQYYKAYRRRYKEFAIYRYNENMFIVLF